jgi:hypothetical protein
MKLSIPARQGARPSTTKTNPHQQLDQHPPKNIIEKLREYILTFQNIIEAPTHISVPGTPAFFLTTCERSGFEEGFIVDNEFVHIHPLPDGSLHIALPEDVGMQMTALQWGEPHVLAGMHGLPKTIYMLYAPRDENELSVTKKLIEISYEFAKQMCSN